MYMQLVFSQLGIITVFAELNVFNLIFCVLRLNCNLKRPCKCTRTGEKELTQVRSVY